MKTRREPLGREAIVKAAMDIADSEGVGALSMRTLARSLGFEVMSLYNHVANKPELLGLMVDVVAGGIQTPPDAPGSLDGARSFAISMRAALVEHRWAVGLWQRQLPGAAQSQRMEGLLRTLSTSGLSPELAHHGFHAIVNHVLGYSLQELELNIGIGAPDSAQASVETYLSGLTNEEHPHLIAHVHQHIEGDTASSFEMVLDFILDGLLALNRAST